jgi:hypothetical protein
MKTLISASCLAAVLAAAPLLAQQEPHRKIPKDSIEVTVNGCLKGRVLQVSKVRQTDTESGPPITQRSLRLAGKKDVMKDVKANDGRFVEVIGLVRKSALVQPGIRFRGGRVVVGGGSGAPGSGIPDPVENVVVLDVSSVTSTGGECR